MAGTNHNFHPFPSEKSQYLYGSWINVDRYLGLEFQLGGSTYFGWAEFNVSWSSLFLTATATLEGYAYDTVAGQGLAAGQTTSTPEPGTLGLLAGTARARLLAAKGNRIVSSRRSALGDG